MTSRTKHPLNAAGDFYVVQGCCPSCGVPDANAPELFGWDNEQHCFMKRQPQTWQDLQGMISAMEAADLSCIRYCGKDRAIFDRLHGNYCIDQADFAPSHLRLRDAARRRWQQFKRFIGI